MCVGCEARFRVLEVTNPQSYRLLMHELAQDIGNGKLNELGDLPSIAQIVQNWPLQNVDYVNRTVQCAACRQGFVISVETYHGLGGSWRPADG
jgi:hypothetical protein